MARRLQGSGVRKQKILESYVQGFTHAIIAKWFKISRQYVSFVISHYGQCSLKDRERELLKRGGESYLLKNQARVEYLWKNGISKKYVRNKDKVLLTKAFGENFTVFRNGWPDYLIKKDGKWICAEIKHEKDQMRLPQLLLKKFFDSVGVEYKILRP